MKKRVVGLSVLFLGLAIFVGMNKNVIGEWKTIKVAKLDLKKAWNATGGKLWKRGKKVVNDSAKKVFKFGAEKATRAIEKTEEAINNIAKKTAHLMTKPLRKEIKKQKAIKQNPYNARPAEHRAGGPMSLQEKKHFEKSLLVSQKILKEKFGFTIPLKYVPFFWISLSGGGARAEMASYALLSELHALGWFEAATHMSTLSGSGWLVWPLLVWMAKTGGTIEQYKERLISILTHGPELWSLTHLTGIVNLVLRSLAYGRRVSFADFYGAFLASILFHDFGANGDPQQVYMDDLIPVLQGGNMPYPVLTILSSPDLRWWTVTPHEVGCAAINLFVAQWAFNRKGGAPWDRENISRPVGDSSLAPGASLGELYNHMFSKINKEPVRTLTRTLMKESPLKRVRPLFSEKENPFIGFEGLPIYDKHEKNKTYTTAKTINFTDPGVIYGNPVIPAMERLLWDRQNGGKRPLILIVGEFSAEVGYEELKKLVDYFAGENADGKVFTVDPSNKKPLFVNLGGSRKTFSQNAMTVLKNDNMLMFYLPRIKDEKLIKRYKDDPEFKKHLTRVANLGTNVDINERYRTFTEQLIDRVVDLGTNMDISSLYQTFKLKYTRKEVENFMALIHFNVHANAARIIEEIKKFMLDYIRRNDPAAYRKIRQEISSKAVKKLRKFTPKSGLKKEPERFKVIPPERHKVSLPGPA